MPNRQAVASACNERGREMPEKLDDVARLAGVSAATVSRALRGVPGVADGTRTRVLAAAARLGYAISPAASSLATGRTGTVGVIVPYVDRWYFARLISGVERVLRDAGTSLLLYNLGDEPGRARFFADLPLRRRVDAVLVLSLPLTGRRTRTAAGPRHPAGHDRHRGARRGLRRDRRPRRPR